MRSGVRRGSCVEDLERDGRLALDDVGVVEGRQEERAGLGGEGLRRGSVASK